MLGPTEDFWRKKNGSEAKDQQFVTHENWERKIWNYIAQSYLEIGVAKKKKMSQVQNVAYA